MKIERKYDGKKPWDDNNLQKLVSEQTWQHLQADPEFQDLRDKLNNAFKEMEDLMKYGVTMVTHPIDQPNS